METYGKEVSDSIPEFIDVMVTPVKRVDRKDKKNVYSYLQRTQNNPKYSSLSDHKKSQRVKGGCEREEQKGRERDDWCNHGHYAS